MNRNIAVLPGDGVGPEIMKEAVEVLDAVAQKYGHRFEYRYADVGACAIDKYGDPYPSCTDEVCKSCDAVLFGAIGDPKYDDPAMKVRPEQGLLRMRKSLGLYANIRPVEPYPSLYGVSPLKEDRIAGTDFVIIRELTGGLYFGEPRGLSEDGRTAYDMCRYTVEEIQRIAEVAFKYAMKRRKKLTLVDKANVLVTSRLWRRTVTAMKAESYPQVALDYMYVDNAAMRLAMSPSNFDVVLTENMFGDILSDLGGAIGGSIGMLPSASEGTEHCLFEPIHGSYPQAKGKGIANPIAQILSAAMMLDDAFGLAREAKAVKEACKASVENKISTPDLMPEGGKSTSEVGNYIKQYILNH